ncbi:hypothetical protein QCA50_009834 [Cerrena zonata]|uniref:Uncharacterized protein n=1 Tax=Cerrena zonata TaxID=2478898 RepID=A0AAW0G1W5_9APHY
MSDEPYLSESCPAPDPSINPPTQIEEYFRDIQSAFTSGVLVFLGQSRLVSNQAKENNGVFQSLRQRFEGQYPTLSTLDENSGIKNTTSRRKWLRQLRLKLAQEHNTLPPAIIVNVTDVDYKNAIEGGFGIVIKAVFNGSTVAVKFLRLTNIKKERRKGSTIFIFTLFYIRLKFILRYFIKKL